MVRLLWWAGEVVVGLLVSGLVLGVAVPATTRLGLPNGPWMLGVGLVVGVAFGLWAGERLRRSLSGPGAS